MKGTRLRIRSTWKKWWVGIYFLVGGIHFLFSMPDWYSSFLLWFAVLTFIILLPDILRSMAFQVEAMSERQKKLQYVGFIIAVVAGIPLCIFLYIYTQLNS